MSAGHFGHLKAVVLLSWNTCVVENNAVKCTRRLLYFLNKWPKHELWESRDRFQCKKTRITTTGSEVRCLSAYNNTNIIPQSYKSNAVRTITVTFKPQRTHPVCEKMLNSSAGNIQWSFITHSFSDQWSFITHRSHTHTEHPVHTFVWLL